MKQVRKKERSGDTVAEWSMALLLREKINDNQKILGPCPGNLKNKVNAEIMAPRYFP